jgi:hypothetical protein
LRRSGQASTDVAMPLPIANPLDDRSAGPYGLGVHPND